MNGIVSARADWVPAEMAPNYGASVGLISFVLFPAETTHLFPAKVPFGPFRSIETLASTLHCARISKVAPHG
jgi:hypothetical protein